MMKHIRTKIIMIIALAAATGLVYAGSGFRIDQLFKDSGSVSALVDTTGEADEVEIIGVPTHDDPSTEMEKIMHAAYPASGIEYKGTMNVIDDNGEKEKVIEQNDFQYTLADDGNYQYRIGSLEYIKKSNFILAVDHENKTISFVRVKASPASANLFDVRKFREVIAQKKAHVLVTTTEKEKIITIDSIQDESVQGYRVYYSPNTYQINKVLIGMVRLTPFDDDESKTQTTEDNYGQYEYYVEVNFSSVSRLAGSGKAFQPEKKYVTIVDGKVELAAGANGYALLNNITL